MKRALSLILALVLLIGMMPMTAFTTEETDATGIQNPFAGKKVSILSHSMSTYAGVSNNTSANSTIGKNDVYYTEGRHGVYLKDTWWMQTIDALDMELLVNNSWSGSCIFQPRKGETSVGYGDRAVNLHNDHTGEEPDIIFVYLGCNDFAYFKDTFGKAADVDYAALIQDNGNGTYTYAVPTTACEAYAIMLHKVENRYPNAEIYCMTSTARREIDYAEDNRPDAGQPTAYVAELQKIANHFCFPVVDLENAIPKDVEIFDKYIGDKRAHANALGMDQITNEVLSVMLDRQAEICHVTADHEAVAEQAVLLGGSYNAEVNIPQGYSVAVTMGGRDVTASAYKDGRIAITEVTGDIHVETVINRDPQNFRWEFQNGILTSVGSSENILTKLSGTVANNILNDGIFQLNTPVVLKHDLPWAVEWKCSEDWRGAVLVTHKESATKDMTFLTRTKGGQLCFGTYTGSQYDNYGIDISGLNADTHTYRLENRMAADGSNMVWLYVDGEEIGPMNNYFIGSKDQQSTSNWVSGKDFVFSFIGMTGHALRNCQLDYLSVTECDHHYENSICTGCGEADPDAAEPLDLRYDDHYDVIGKTVEIIDAGTPTSYQVGYGVEENAVPDTAVVTLEGNYLVATGIGTAIVKVDGETYEITVTAAPISLLLIIGQSNAEGMVGRDHQSIACENGQVYSTYAEANGLTGDAGLTVDNAGNYVPSALAGAYSTININGTDSKISNYPVNSLTEAGNGKYGMDSGIAYEWVQQTGEKVWVVNAAHGASSISSWQPGESNFEEAVALMDACQNVLTKEIAAGHFTFSHMGYYWCQGCADETKSAQWYVERYVSMHEALKVDMAFDADLNPVTTDVTMEFGGIILVMAGHENATGYRKGAYKDESEQFFATFKELEMRGPRVAQIWLSSNPNYADIHLVCMLAQDWVTMPDGSDGVAEYFASHYENGVIDYPTQVKQSPSWYSPTTPAHVKNSIHYYQVGYNEVGRESARNTLYILGVLEKPNVDTTVSFVDWTGYQTVDSITSSGVGSPDTLIVPLVSPCYESKTVSYTLSDGLSWNYYDLLDTGVDGGTLTTSIDTQKVAVTGREYCAYRFELVDGKLVSVSNDTFRENLLTATTVNTYTLEDTIILKHDKKWIVEFNSVAADRFMALASYKSSTDEMFYFFKSKSGSGVLSIGEYKDGLYQNYGLKQTQINIDWTYPHVYRFQNVINPDGTNIIHIYIDGEWRGTATNLIINDVLQSTDNMYLSGKDFAFVSIGCGGFGFGNNQMTYIEVWEDYHTHTYENGICTGCGKTSDLIITQQPENISADRFEEVVVSAAAEGAGVVYQWYYRCAGEADFRVSSSTGDTFRTVMSSDLHGCEVYCVITDETGNSVTSDIALLTLTSEAAPETPPARIPGDINGDGEVNNKDLTRLFRYLSGYDVEIN